MVLVGLRVEGLQLQIHFASHLSSRTIVRARGFGDILSGYPRRYAPSLRRIPFDSLIPTYIWRT